MENYFELDKIDNQGEFSFHNVELPIIQFDFTNYDNSIFYGGIGAQIIVHKLNRLTIGVAPIISCKLIEVNSEKVIQELVIMTSDFSTGPLKAPYDKTIKKEFTPFPLELETGSYRLDLCARWAMFPNPLGGYGIVGSGYLFMKVGNTFATEKFEPRQGSMSGEIKRTFIF